MEEFLRRLLRIVGFLGIAASLLARGARASWGQPLSHATVVRANLLMRHARAILLLFGVRVVAPPFPQGTRILVANHTGYLDILVLASLTPVAFVSKAEVRRWPLLGSLASVVGTIFVDRTRRGDVARVGRLMEVRALDEITLVFFPEGTSSDGREVLPFHSALLAPAAQQGWWVLPVRLAYARPDGAPAPVACWWGDAWLLPHLWRFLGCREIIARVAWGESLVNPDRKLLARGLRDRVATLPGMG